MDGGSSSGTYGLGYATWMGKGTPKDVAKARLLFESASVAGEGGALAYKALATAVCDEPGPERNAHAQLFIRKAITTQV